MYIKKIKIKKICTFETYFWTTHDPFSILIPAHTMWRAKLVLNASFQDFKCTKIYNHLICFEFDWYFHCTREISFLHTKGCGNAPFTVRFGYVKSINFSTNNFLNSGVCVVNSERLFCSKKLYIKFGIKAFWYTIYIVH